MKKGLFLLHLLSMNFLLFADLTVSGNQAISSNGSHINVAIQPGGTLTVQSGYTLEVAYLSVQNGGSLIVEAGAVLSWPFTGNANIRGLILVNGEVSMQGNIYLENGGEIHVTSTGSFTATSSGGSLSNSGGKIAIDEGGEMSVENYQNYGGAIIEVDGTLNVNGNLTNSGDIDGDGVLVVSGTTNNQHGGSTFGDDSSNPDCSSGCGGEALPVQLVSFEVQLDEKGRARLTWKTASELENDFFTIEKSLDGVEFYTVMTLKGAGTSEEGNSYSWEDPKAVVQTTYYRLSQTDYDGTVAYIGLKPAFAGPIPQGFSFYPNIIHNGEKITFSQATQEQIGLFDLNGGLVRQWGPAGYVMITGVNPGVYLIGVIGQNEAKHLSRLIVR